MCIRDRDYGSAADRMGAIAEVFPLFFFLVAALICLTTMTRMVDEQRGTIGTLKALGYSKVKIAVKYLCYAFLSSFGGSVIGVLDVYKRQAAMSSCKSVTGSPLDWK